MIEKDFFNLKIGQEIWWKGNKEKIYGLWIYENKPNRISFDKDCAKYTETWEDICADCSLEPPKPKEKWYIHEYWVEQFGYKDIWYKNVSKTKKSWNTYDNGTGNMKLISTREVEE